MLLIVLYNPLNEPVFGRVSVAGVLRRYPPPTFLTLYLIFLLTLTPVLIGVP